MLACTKALARELSQQFRSRAIEKTYLALVLGGSREFSAKQGLISGSLSFDDGRVQLGTEEEPGSKSALTTWEVLAFSVRSLLQNLPKNVNTIANAVTALACDVGQGASVTCAPVPTHRVEAPTTSTHGAKPKGYVRDR